MGTATLSANDAAIARPEQSAYPRRAMGTEDPDLELVRLAQGGDKRAFEALVVKYQRRIARHVARYVRRADDVEDVVQEIFIKVYRGIASFKGESLFYTWLYRIGTNCALNHLRRNPNVVALQDDLRDTDDGESVDLAGSSADDPERILLAKQISQTIERAMARLQPELAEALTLYEVDGKQYKEIAQMLGVPIGTVRTRIFRARDFVAKRLEPIIGPDRDRRW